MDSDPVTKETIFDLVKSIQNMLPQILDELREIREVIDRIEAQFRLMAG